MPNPLTPTWRARTAKIIKRLGLFYLGVCLLLGLLQDYLVFPGKLTQGRAEAVVSETSAHQLIKLTTSDQQTTYALYTSSRSSRDGSPTLLFFYGNGMSLASMPELHDAVAELRLSVITVEYLGYGMASGKPSEQGCYLAADAAYDWLINEQHVDPKTIIVGGVSLGGAVACDLASRKPVGGLLMLGSFTSLVEAGKYNYPFLPVRFLLRYHFASLEKLKSVTVPVAIVHGTMDRLVPVAMAHTLASAASNLVSCDEVPGAGHNDLLDLGWNQVAQRLRELSQKIASDR